MQSVRHFKVPKWQRRYCGFPRHTHTLWSIKLTGLRQTWKGLHRDTGYSSQRETENQTERVMYPPDAKIWQRMSAPTLSNWPDCSTSCRWFRSAEQPLREGKHYTYKIHAQIDRGERKREKKSEESQHDTGNPLLSNTEQQGEGKGYVCM